MLHDGGHFPLHVLTDTIGQDNPGRLMKNETQSIKTKRQIGFIQQFKFRTESSRPRKAGDPQKQNKTKQKCTFFLFTIIGASI